MSNTKNSYVDHNKGATWCRYSKSSPATQEGSGTINFTFPTPAPSESGRSCLSLSVKEVFTKLDFLGWDLSRASFDLEKHRKNLRNLAKSSLDSAPQKAKRSFSVEMSHINESIQVGFTNVPNEESRNFLKSKGFRYDKETRLWSLGFDSAYEGLDGDISRFLEENC